MGERMHLLRVRYTAREAQVRVRAGVAAYEIVTLDLARVHPALRALLAGE